MRVILVSIVLFAEVVAIFFFHPVRAFVVEPQILRASTIDQHMQQKARLKSPRVHKQVSLGSTVPFRTAFF